MDNKLRFDDAFQVLPEALASVIEDTLRAKYLHAWQAEYEIIRKSYADEIAKKYERASRYEPLPMQAGRIQWDPRDIIEALDLCWPLFSARFPRGRTAKYPVLLLRDAGPKAAHPRRENRAWFDDDRNTQSALWAIRDVLAALGADEGRAFVGDRITDFEESRVQPGSTAVPPAASAASEATGSWSRFVSSAVRSGAIRILPVELPGSTVGTRSLGPITSRAEFGSVPRFTQMERVRLEIDLNLLNPRVALPINCLCIVADDEQVTCLCPNPMLAPDGRVTQPTFTIPRLGVKEPLAFYGAIGRHEIYIILTKHSLPRPLYNFLQHPVPAADWDQIANSILSISDTRILKAECLVDP